MSLVNKKTYISIFLINGNFGKIKLCFDKVQYDERG